MVAWGTVKVPPDETPTLILSDEDTSPLDVLALSAARGRYIDVGLLGEGGMGTVRRVRDPRLNRTLALKAIKADLIGKTSLVDRFISEAQVTAQLDHPGIVAVHDVGILADGRWYFTMAEVRGRPLGDVIVEVHRAATEEAFLPAESGWTFRRVIDALHAVAETMGYAHERGVIHRDLKPENVMVGTHGQVTVLDWGLAKVLGRPDTVDDEPIETDRSRDRGATKFGAIAGTPWFMSPEQAHGQTDRIDARSDVYAIGALLYMALHGNPPYGYDEPNAVIARVRNGPPASLRIPVPGRPPLPDELVAICERAMARDAHERFQNGAELANAIVAWLDGATRREDAEKLVALADRRMPDMLALRDAAGRLQRQAETKLANVQPYDPEEAKAPGWALADAAIEATQRADLIQSEALDALHAALGYVPDLASAHVALAAHSRAVHLTAEVARDTVAATRAEQALRRHAERLPRHHPARRGHVAYLKGYGALSIDTSPPGAEVFLERYVTRNRRLVTEEVGSLGKTPIRAAGLKHGSYRLRIEAPGHATVRYPVLVEREQHWDGRDPDGNVVPVRLPTLAELGPDDVYVPAGWYNSGGDPEPTRGLPSARVWLDSFVMRRFPITNGEYLVFLNDLLARGQDDLADRYVPRERGAHGRPGTAVYARVGRTFALGEDAEGDRWLPDWPVMMVDGACADAYARWYADRTKAAWRLPGEHEWEKAARGADARLWPFGNTIDPAWACYAPSHKGRPLPDLVTSFPVDESPYGVRGLAGNVEDWTSDPYTPDGPELENGRWRVGELHVFTDLEARVTRGGGWSYVERITRSTLRGRSHHANRGTAVGFRLVRSA